MTLRTVNTTEMPCNALGIKSNAYIEMKLGSWIKKSGISSVNTKGIWKGPFTTPQLPISQIEKEGIKMKIMSSGSLGGSDTVIAQSTIFLTQLLSQPNEWIDITGQLALDNKYSGKFSACGMFLSPDSSVPLDRNNVDEEIISNTNKIVPKVPVPVPIPVVAPLTLVPTSTSTTAAVSNAAISNNAVSNNAASNNAAVRTNKVSVTDVTGCDNGPSSSTSSSSSSSSSNPAITAATSSVKTGSEGGGGGGGRGSEVISLDKLDKLNGMFEGVQKQNLDLQLKVGGLEKGIKTQLNQVSLFDFCLSLYNGFV